MIIYPLTRLGNHIPVISLEQEAGVLEPAEAEGGGGGPVPPVHGAARPRPEVGGGQLGDPQGARASLLFLLNIKQCQTHL